VTKTPRTDAEATLSCDFGLRSAFVVHVEFARELEREIERLRAERDQARAEVVDRALGNTSDVPWDKNHPARERCMKYARKRGWHDLFEYINAIADGRTNENPKG